MATHDYIISNASGAAVRSDLNNALSAIVSNNSSATEPATTYAYQMWADTGSTPAVMKLRDSTNSSWITLYNLDGSSLPIASATEIVFNDAGADLDFRIEGDTDANLLFVDAGNNRIGVGTASPSAKLDVNGSVQFGDGGGFDMNINGTRHQFSIGGSEKMRIDSSGNLGINTTSPDRKLHVAGDWIRVDDGYGLDTSGGTEKVKLDNGYIALTTASIERARIDSSGRLLVGDSSNSTIGKLVVRGRGNTTGAAPATMVLQRNSAAGSSDGLAEIYFADDDESILGYVSLFADGTQSGSSKPSKLSFATTASSATSPTEKMLLTSDGSFYLSSNWYNNSTTANAANVWSAGSGEFYRSTSSIKYKTEVETLQDSYADAILNCRPVWYRSTCEADNPGWGWWGFIAEEVAEIDPRLVHWKTIEVTYDEKGSAVESPCDPEPEGVAYDRFVPHLLNLIKRQQQTIETLEAKVAALESA